MRMTEERLREGLENIDELINLYERQIALYRKLKLGLIQKFDKEKADENEVVGV
jgi:hypothetical protein